MRKRLSCLSLVLLATLILTACTPSESEHADIFTVRTGAIRKAIYASGETACLKKTIISYKEDIKIVDSLVPLGSAVTSGMPIFDLDIPYIEDQIASIQHEISETMKTISAYPKNGKEKVYVRPLKGGYIKNIQAQKGESVKQIMDEKGYLALLSYDNQMKFTIETDSFTVSEAVSVHSNGAQYSGIVTQVQNGNSTISINTLKPSIGATAFITKDGKKFSGLLELVDYEEILFSDGLTQKVLVHENDRIEALDAIFEIEITPSVLSGALGKIEDEQLKLSA